MSEEIDVSTTIAPKSDQLNADDLIGRTLDITVERVTKGSAEQPITIHYEGDNGRPFKPCLSMRRLLTQCWGGTGYKGKRMRLFCDPSAMYGGKKVGGVRISHVSDIDGDKEVLLTTRRGHREWFTVKPMPTAVAKKETVAPADRTEDELLSVMRLAAMDGLDAMRAKWKTLTKGEQETIKPHLDTLTAAAGEAEGGEG
jgi:hypothetical protein